MSPNPVVRVLLTLGLAVGVLVAGGSAASAHAQLVSVSPTNGATVPVAPATVVLTFNEKVAQVGAAIKVIDSEGVDIGDGAPVVSGTKITQKLQSNLPSGGYQVTYRVTSVDGHPVSGTTTFTATAAQPGAAPSSPPASPTPPATTAATTPAQPTTGATPSAAAPTSSAAGSAEPASGGPFGPNALLLLALAAGIFGVLTLVRNVLRARRMRADGDDGRQH